MTSAVCAARCSHEHAECYAVHVSYGNDILYSSFLSNYILNVVHQVNDRLFFRVCSGCAFDPEGRVD